MSAARTKSPDARRTELVNAALGLFAEKGVASTTVSDIVGRAGVAQGTFYLYFESKNEIINAVVGRLTDGAVESIVAALGREDLGVLEKIEAMAHALVEMSDEPHEIELMRFFHRAENAAVHDRFARSINDRITPLLADVIRLGIAEGLFVSDIEPARTASFVLGGLQTLESDFFSAEGSAESVHALEAFVLRGLGYSEPRT